MATFDKNASAHCLSLLVANRPGVLVRIALVFSRRGYNLDSLVQRTEGDLRPQGHHLGHIRRSDRPPAALHMDGSRRLIQQVDGLIRQKAVVDIAHGKLIGRCQGLLIQADPMVLLQGGPQALEHFQGLLPARLRHLHRLEAPLQGRVLLDMAAVFLRRGGADDLHLPSPKSGL